MTFFSVNRQPKKNLQKTSNLIKMMYPGYLEITEKRGSTKKVVGEVLSKSPLVKVKFANLIKNFENEDLQNLDCCGTSRAKT